VARKVEDESRNNDEEIQWRGISHRLGNAGSGKATASETREKDRRLNSEMDNWEDDRKLNNDEGAPISAGW
jgi:hypothetical protein